nr:hypothetical protein CFP56_09173 [Quercus suber]
MCAVQRPVTMLPKAIGINSARQHADTQSHSCHRRRMAQEQNRCGIESESVFLSRQRGATAVDSLGEVAYKVSRPTVQPSRYSMVQGCEPQDTYDQQLLKLLKRAEAFDLGGGAEIPSAN